MPVINFSAGPAVLPREVLEEARDQLLDYRGSGMSVMEMSHRSPHYDAIHTGTLDRLRGLLSIPDDYEVLLLQGGASLQFTMVPMNLMPRTGRAGYVLTGSWSKKAHKEAALLGEADVAASTESDGFSRLPKADEIHVHDEAAYLHLTSNNTIFGTQWNAFPKTPARLVADMSSDILSRPFPVRDFGLIYAGAQKNMGPSGVTVVVVDKALLETIPEGLPTMLDYRTHASKGSLYNTPPCWAIYMVGLTCRWLEDLGGLTAIEERNRGRANVLYGLIDEGDFYRGTASREARSAMNVTFRLRDETLEKAFVDAARAEGMENLKGHRSVGGIRASIYNALPTDHIETLAQFMKDFERNHG